MRVNITFIFNIFYSRCRSRIHFSPLPNTGIFKRRNKIEEHYLPRARATITLLRILNSPIIHESRSRPQSLETRELNRIAQLNLTAIPHEILADELLRTDVGIIAFPSSTIYLCIRAARRLLKYRTSSLIGPGALGKLLTAPRKSAP